MRRAVWALLIAVTAVGILFLFVLPGQALLQQRRDLRSTRADLHALNAENGRLAHQIKSLKNDHVIENMAREQYGLVMPGQKAYAIVPSPSTGGSSSGTTNPPSGSSSGITNPASGSRPASGSSSPSSPTAGHAPKKQAVRESSVGSSPSFWQRLEFWN